MSEPVLCVHNKSACDSLLEYVSNTPLIRLRGLESEIDNARVEFYAKAEWFNPGGKVNIRTEEAHTWVYKMAKEHGLFVGLSGGAAIGGALDVGRKLASGVVVTLLPDAGTRYFSVRF